MRIKVFQLYPAYGTNTYLIYNDNEAIVIDPASDTGNPFELTKFLDDNNLNLKMALLTHGHADHIGGLTALKKKYDMKILINNKDAEMLTDSKKNLSAFMGKDSIQPKADKLLSHEDIISFAGKNIKVIHTPGHTKGGTCFLLDNHLFCGDTIFDHSIGRTDLPGGNHQQLLNMIVERIFTLPEETILYPGHGGTSSVEDEKVGNPFVGILSQQ